MQTLPSTGRRASFERGRRKGREIADELTPQRNKGIISLSPSTIGPYMEDAEIRSEMERLRKREEELQVILMQQREYAEKLLYETSLQKQRQKNLKLSLIAVALAASIAATIPVVTQIVGLGKIDPIHPSVIFGNNVEKFATKRELESLMANSEKVKFRYDSLMEELSKGASSGESNVEIADLSVKFDEVRKRLELLEKAISDSPEKALSIPMIRKDQENISKALDAHRAVVSADLARINDLQKWILGGIGTVLVAGIAALFTALFRVMSKGRADE